MAPNRGYRPARESVFERLLGPDTVLQSEAVYEDILPGADWRCQINGNAFKDEVVFHRAEQAAPVTFRLHAPRLLLVQGGQGELLLEDAQHHPVFLLPEPWAMSADEAQEAGRVQVRIAQSSPHDWLLTYTMDSDWLSQATFPVRLDPAVVTYNIRCAIDDAYTCSKQPNTVHKGSSSNILRLTHSSGNWGQCDCYFRFDNTVLPTLRSSDYIVQATFTVATASRAIPPPPLRQPRTRCSAIGRPRR